MELHASVTRVRAEFLEMPGLRLTLAQATRLWGMEQALCATVMDALVRASFLRPTSGGTYMLAQQ